LDIWNDLLLHEKLPRLFTFAKKSKDLSGFLSTIDLASHFHLPLSEQSYEEYQERRETKYSNWTGRQRSMTIHSRIKKYTTNNYYKYLHKEIQPSKHFL
jgi:hypothetical protein